MSAKKDNRQRGTAMVEAALTLLVLFTFLLGLIEVSHVLSVQQVITDAAREGARKGVAPYWIGPSVPVPLDGEREACVFLTAASITQSVDTCAVDSTLNRIPVACDPQGLDSTKCTVQVPYHPLTLSMFGNFSITLKGEAVMLNEYGQ